MNGSILAGGGSGGGLTDWLRLAISARRDRENRDMDKVNQMMKARALRAKMDQIQNTRNQQKRLQEAQDFKEESYETDLTWDLLEPAKDELVNEREAKIAELRKKLEGVKKPFPLTGGSWGFPFKRIGRVEAGPQAILKSGRSPSSEQVFGRARELREKLRAAVRQREAGGEQARNPEVLPPGTRRLKVIDDMTAAEYMRRAGGDPEVARRMARADGWKF